MNKPIWDLHKDVKFAVDCARGNSNKALEIVDGSGTASPMYYMNESVRSNRHHMWQSIVEDDEEWWEKKKARNAIVDKMVADMRRKREGG